MPGTTADLAARTTGITPTARVTQPSCENTPPPGVEPLVQVRLWLAFSPVNAHCVNQSLPAPCR